MNLNPLEVHDRLQQFNKQSEYISQGCEDCIKNRPFEFGDHSFYIFAHGRTIETDERIKIYNDELTKSLKEGRPSKYPKMENVPTYRYIWSPRLTKPKAQTNSMLFKYYPKTQEVKIIWILPVRELWGQYRKDNVTESEIVSKSIYDFENNRAKLECKDHDDLLDYQVDDIYTQISVNKGYSLGKNTGIFDSIRNL